MSETVKKSKKQKTPGIIYLSRIPPFMGVKHLRQHLSSHGELGKIFLQPNEKEEMTKKKRLRCQFTEGWVEFLDKKVAKQVALSLNGHMIGGKRRSRWYEEMWMMKYLPKFRWAHLNERLEYERMVRKQKLHTEISQAKKEVEFYRLNVERNQAQTRFQKRNDKRTRLQERMQSEFEIPGEGSERAENTKKQSKPDKDSISEPKTSLLDVDATRSGSSQLSSIAMNAVKDSSKKSDVTANKDFVDRDWTFKQRETDDQILSKNRKRKAGRGEPKDGQSKEKKKCEGIKVPAKAADDKLFLKTLFSGGLK